MSLILSEILTLSQHLNALEQTPELYRPNACIHCHETMIWRYGYYYRKPDRLNHGEDSLNDIPIPRFQCVACRRTFSTLPECIAPRRWYPWFVQQWCLYCCLKGCSVRRLNQVFLPSRSTISRWFHWLEETFTEYHRVLCSKFASLGYFATCRPFWLHWLDSKLLSHAMVLLNQEAVIVP